jgi:hypothetical protein
MRKRERAILQSVKIDAKLAKELNDLANREGRFVSVLTTTLIREALEARAAKDAA